MGVKLKYYKHDKSEIEFGVGYYKPVMIVVSNQKAEIEAFVDKYWEKDFPFVVEPEIYSIPDKKQFYCEITYGLCNKYFFTTIKEVQEIEREYLKKEILEKIEDFSKK